jgi:hypothetical protein
MYWYHSTHLFDGYQVHTQHLEIGPNKFVSNIYMLKIYDYLPQFFRCYAASEVQKIVIKHFNNRSTYTLK